MVTIVGKDTVGKDKVGKDTWLGFNEIQTSKNFQVPQQNKYCQIRPDPVDDSNLDWNKKYKIYWNASYMYLFI